MKLILKQYLSGLRERGELDAIIPDLLSQLGLNVFSRPRRGTRQDGVDVAAVGSLDDGKERVYLFSIKPGDLTRKDWDGDTVQSLRPSLNEIVDAYIPNRLPPEHRNKDIVICIGIGGDVQEQVRPQLAGFVQKNTTDRIAFEEWNGDKIASKIQSCFLREELLPEIAQSQFRKSLAMLDEPSVSFRHFSALIKSIVTIRQDDAKFVLVLRQISICIWVLFGWAREAENLEAAYQAGELSLLHGWKIRSICIEKSPKLKKPIEIAFNSIFLAYQQICRDYISTNVLPHACILHGLSCATMGSSSLDVNLKLFDLLGRLSIEGIWSLWAAKNTADVDPAFKDGMLRAGRAKLDRSISDKLAA